MCGQVPGNKAAIGQQYNVASDRYISHDGVVQALAKAAGVEANIVHYDTKEVSLAKVHPPPFNHGSKPCSSNVQQTSTLPSAGCD